jgi:hypothetical protein
VRNALVPPAQLGPADRKVVLAANRSYRAAVPPERSEGPTAKRSHRERSKRSYLRFGLYTWVAVPKNCSAASITVSVSVGCG